MKKKKLLIPAAIAVLFLEILAIAGLTSAVHTMHHEGLTYSQWYDASIYGLYSAILITIVCTTLLLLVWIPLFFRPSLQITRTPRFRKICRILCIIFAVVTVLLTILAVSRHQAVRSAELENVDVLAPFIHAYGKALAALLLSFEAFLLSLFLSFRKIRSEQD